MGRGVILVRHALPEVVPGLSSKLWVLGESAKEDCVLLAHALPPDLAPILVASGVPKANETAMVLALRLGLTVESDPRVAEVDQPTTWFEGDYRAVAAEYLRGSNPHAWEPHHGVVARFAAAVEERLGTLLTGDLVVVNHGLAMSLYLASRAAVDLVPFWEALTFPDAWRLDLESGELSHLFHAGLPPPDG